MALGLEGQAFGDISFRDIPELGESHGKDMRYFLYLCQLLIINVKFFFKLCQRLVIEYGTDEKNRKRQCMRRG